MSGRRFTDMAIPSSPGARAALLIASSDVAWVTGPGGIQSISYHYPYAGMGGPGGSECRVALQLDRVYPIPVGRVDDWLDNPLAVDPADPVAYPRPMQVQPGDRLGIIAVGFLGSPASSFFYTDEPGYVVAVSRAMPVMGIMPCEITLADVEFVFLPEDDPVP